MSEEERRTFPAQAPGHGQLGSHPGFSRNRMPQGGRQDPLVGGQPRHLVLAVKRHRFFGNRPLGGPKTLHRKTQLGHEGLRLLHVLSGILPGSENGETARWGRHGRGRHLRVQEQRQERVGVRRGGNFHAHVGEFAVKSQKLSRAAHQPLHDEPAVFLGIAPALGQKLGHQRLPAGVGGGVSEYREHLQVGEVGQGQAGGDFVVLGPRQLSGQRPQAGEAGKLARVQHERPAHQVFDRLR
ncbi:hypothetical protein HRbin09_02017 [bacterium HR09]|nr:hypothetical protein HRbin09_02017 [bacterium HR09]